MHDKIKNTSSDMMNYKASIGLCTKADLEEWARFHNSYLKLMIWKVKEVYVVTKYGTRLSPKLYYEFLESK